MRHLRMLQAMARTGSVTRAAAMLGLTQSALSHQIREAERRLGLDLFVQRDKRMQMTPVAQTLSEEAGRILAQLERLEQHIAREGGVMRHIVRIGCGAYSGYHWLPRFLQRLPAARRRHRYRSRRRCDPAAAAGAARSRHRRRRHLGHAGSGRRRARCGCFATSWC